MKTRLLTAPLLFVMAVGLWGAGLPQGLASARGEPPTPPATETFTTRFRFEGLLDVLRLPPAKEPLVQDAPQASLAPEYASWSRLVFQSLRNQNDWEVYRASGDGANQVNLSNNGAADIHPRLNRGATSVVFASKRDGNYEIYMMNAEGGGQTRLTATSADDVNPAWSPDGGRIAFQSYRDGQAEIYVMNADGGGQTRLSNYGDYDGEPAWSPDGTQIAFTRKSSGQYQIWAMNADGGNLRQLSSQSFSEYPAWSPDGSQIAFDADGNGDGWQELWLMDATGGNQRQIYDPPEPDTDAWVRSWSPDGRYIAFTRIAWTFYQNQWYWTTAYLDALNPQNPYDAMRLSSNEADWNPDWQSTDVWAPSSGMQTLPAYSRATGVEVRWEGSDVGPAGVVSYDVQYRSGPTGAWTPWFTGTSETSAMFAGVGGQTVAFRVRARDAAGNLEAWPAADAADTSTTSFTWQLTGRLTDNRGVAIGGATIGITPAPLLTVQTGADGKYLAYLTTSGDHSITVDRAGYGPLAVSPVAINQDRRLDYYLPPAQNLITNGGFEADASLPSDWVLAGPADTSTVSTVAHTGTLALQLGRECPYPCLTAAGWLEGSNYPDMASDSQGKVYLLWGAPVMDQHGSVYIQARIASRPAGGSWSEPQELGVLGGYDTRAGIAIDDHDMVHVILPEVDGLYYRSLEPGGQWSTPQPVAESGGSVDMAADHLGGLHVIYHNQWGTRQVNYLERLPTGDWQPPMALSTTEDYHGPGIAVGADASVHFIYQRSGHVFYRWRPYGRTIQPEEQLSTDDGYSSVTFDRESVAVGSDGTVHVIYDHAGNWYRSRLVGGSWSTPTQMNTNGTVEMAIDRADIIHLAGTKVPWDDLYYRNLAPDGTWKPLATFGESRERCQALTVDSQGRVHIASFLMSAPQGLYYWTSLTPSQAYTVTASQRVTIPADMHRPTLAANYASSGGTAPLSIGVDTGISATEVFSASAKAAWQLAHADLTPWAGQQVTVTLRLHQMPDTAYTQIRVDDVTLGEWTTPVIASVDPPRAEAFTATPIVIHGMNFIATPTVRVGPIEAENVTRIDEQTLQATVPAALGPGIHDLWVTNPGGAATLLAGAFRSGEPTYLPLIRR